MDVSHGSETKGFSSSQANYQYRSLLSLSTQIIQMLPWSGIIYYIIYITTCLNHWSQFPPVAGKFQCSFNSSRLWMCFPNDQSPMPIVSQENASAISVLNDSTWIFKFYFLLKTQWNSCTFKLLGSFKKDVVYDVWPLEVFHSLEQMGFVIALKYVWLAWH